MRRCSSCSSSRTRLPIRTGFNFPCRIRARTVQGLIDSNDAAASIPSSGFILFPFLLEHRCSPLAYIRAYDGNPKNTKGSGRYPLPLKCPLTSYRNPIFRAAVVNHMNVIRPTWERLDSRDRHLYLLLAGFFSPRPPNQAAMAAKPGLANLCRCGRVNRRLRSGTISPTKGGDLNAALKPRPPQKCSSASRLDICLPSLYFKILAVL